MIVACGEALIDFVPARTPDDAAAYVPRPGGSPFNVAITLGRLGVAVGFLGSVSTDFFGSQLLAALRASNVDIARVSRLDRPSTLAFVNLDAVEPEYTFYDREAAHRFWGPAGELGSEVAMLHFGSLALIAEPAAQHLCDLMVRERGRRILSLDPNIRPSVVGDRERAYRARLATMLGAADLIKISGADLDWLEPQREPAAAAAAWLAAGTSLVVVTQGARGATAYAADGAVVHSPAEPIEVVDTVGAGDSFMGALLAGLSVCGVSAPGQLADIDDATISAVLAFAVRVAAITCRRAGADPPWRDDVALPVTARGMKGTS